MTIPNEKREELLKRGLPEGVLTALEERNKANAVQAESEGRKSKEETAEATETQPVPETTEEVPQPEPQAEKPEEKQVDTSQFPTRDEVAEAIATVLAPQINELKEQLTILSSNLKEMKESEETRIKEILTLTPRDSLTSLMTRRFVEQSSKSSSTVIPKGDELLQNKPKETKVTRPGVGIKFIDKMISPAEEQ